MRRVGYVGVEVVEGGDCGVNFGRGDGRGAVENLAVEVGRLDCIMVD